MNKAKKREILIAEGEIEIRESGGNSYVRIGLPLLHLLEDYEGMRGKLVFITEETGDDTKEME